MFVLLEVSFFVTTFLSVCDDDQFACESGGCIYDTWECDGVLDCVDNSDEQDCCKQSEKEVVYIPVNPNTRALSRHYIFIL